MSNSNGTTTLSKSMNGLIVFNTGGGVVISGDTIVAGSIDLANLNINEIQGLAPVDNISLYTNSIGLITLGSSSAGAVQVESSSGGIFLNAGSGNSVRVANLQIAGAEISSFYSGDDLTLTTGDPTRGILIGGGQSINQQNTVTDFFIGSNITAPNFYLGNNTYCPQVVGTAASAFDVVNYDTCVALIAAGAFGATISVDEILSFNTTSFVSLWTDNTTSIQIGSGLITNTALASFGTNNGFVNIATIANRTAETFIATGTGHSANVYFMSGQNSSGNLYIACNNYPSNTGSTTTNVFIGGSSTSTRFNGTVSICGYSPSAGINYLFTGSNKTVNTQQGSAIYINSTNTTANTVSIGSTSTSTTTMLSSDININSSNANGNTIDIGSSTSTNTLLGTTNINTTGVRDTAIGGGGGDVSITSAAGVALNGGLVLGGSNFTSPIRVAFGRITNTPGTGSPGLSTTSSGSFGVTFGANPFVFLQVIRNTYNGAGQMCSGVESVSTTGFTYNVRNNSNTGAPAGTYYVNWFAIGQY